MGYNMIAHGKDLERRVVRLVALLVLVSGPVVVAAQAPPAPPPAPKDLLVFTNGDQLSGTLERSVGDNVLFKSDMAGEITVPLAKIKELRTQGAFAILKHNDPVAVSRKVVPGKIVLNSTEVSVVANDGGTGASVPVKDVAYLIDAETFNRDLVHAISPWEGWGGTVNLGTNFSQSTIHGGSLTGGFALVRQVPVLTYFRARNRTILNFQENYGVLTTPAALAGTTTDSQSKTSIMHADAERDEYFTKTFYALAITSFDHNYSQSMDLQQIYGGGFGWTAFNNGKHQLDIKADVHYEKQQLFDRSLDQNLIGSTFSESYRRSLPLRMTFTEQASVLPAYNNFHAFSASGTSSLVAPLFHRLSMNVTTTDSFINNPSPGYQKNSFTFTTGLTYSLR
ncbi:DUF481 domain-containing protein [Terriglobus roseus]|nr:DUF481 domain-containing protein [Terriglobus roseus]